MRLIDIWNDILLKRGIPRRIQEAARKLAELEPPAVMLREVPECEVERSRKALEQIADELIRKTR